MNPDLKNLILGIVQNNYVSMSVRDNVYTYEIWSPKNNQLLIRAEKTMLNASNYDPRFSWELYVGDKLTSSGVNIDRHGMINKTQECHDVTAILRALDIKYHEQELLKQTNKVLEHTAERVQQDKDALAFLLEQE